MADFIPLVPGDRYLIRWQVEEDLIEGEHVTTRGNDEEFPHFKVIKGPDHLGPEIGVHISAVVEHIEKGEDEEGVTSTPV